MKELELFKTYNGITRKYVVMAITVQDLLNDPRYKDNKSLLLLAKPNITPTKLRKKRNQKPPKYFKEFAKKQEEFNKKVLTFIETQTKFNEFVLQQFKEHGWIK